MLKSLLSALLTTTLLLVLAQSESGQDDHRYLDPEPSAGRGGEHRPPETQPPGGGVKVKEGVPVVLAYYARGDWNHKYSLRTCRAIVDQIDNYERKENKIISIAVKGFADGWENRGITVNMNRVNSRCAATIPPNGKIKDFELASLRACQMQEMLRDILRGKSYFVSVALSMPTPHDEPTGEGDMTGGLRKVEILITYLERK